MPRLRRVVMGGDSVHMLPVRNRAKPGASSAVVPSRARPPRGIARSPATASDSGSVPTSAGRGGPGRERPRKRRGSKSCEAPASGAASGAGAEKRDAGDESRAGPAREGRKGIIYIRAIVADITFSRPQVLRCAFCILWPTLRLVADAQTWLLFEPHNMKMQIHGPRRTTDDGGTRAPLRRVATANESRAARAHVRTRTVSSTMALSVASDAHRHRRATSQTQSGRSPSARHLHSCSRRQS